MRNHIDAWMTLTSGQPGFFEPRQLSPWFNPTGADGVTSDCESRQLVGALESVVDFDILNGGATRLTVGAVHMRSGNFIYFDSAKEPIDTRHIMASGALPAVKLRTSALWIVYRELCSIMGCETWSAVPAADDVI